MASPSLSQWLSPLLVALALVASGSARADGTPLTQEQLSQILKTIDERQLASGDITTNIRFVFRQKGRLDVVLEAQLHRYNYDEKGVLLFNKPKEFQGKGYLQLGRNLWFYDPGTAKWERRTMRARIADTDSRKHDLSAWELSKDYEASDAGEEKLGVHAVRKLTLKAKEGVDVAFPFMDLWVDANNNPLKRQDKALSGKLMRTLYYPKWGRVFSEAKKGDVWYPEELHIYNEVTGQTSTFIKMWQMDVKPLEANVFTKAYVESKSR